MKKRFPRALLAAWCLGIGLSLSACSIESGEGLASLPRLPGEYLALQQKVDAILDKGYVPAVAESGGASVSKGRLILATVQGDIHDIGKNIVKTVLENYGYQVTDLGRDVAPETIAAAAERQNIRLVGLSALMTTTLPAMEATVRLLKALPRPPAVIVGGAVVTADYAAAIGADYYARDARQSADAAREVLG